MTRQCECQLLLVDAFAVIANPDQLLSTGDDIDLHSLCPGIETVLYQLLHNRRRALNNLAGSDLINQVIWE